MNLDHGIQGEPNVHSLVLPAGGIGVRSRILLMPHLPLTMRSAAGARGWVLPFAMPQLPLTNESAVTVPEASAGLSTAMYIGHRGQVLHLAYLATTFDQRSTVTAPKAL